MRDYEPYYTEDGSIGLYSYAEKDVFHSKYGALTEAWEKFVLPSNIIGLMGEKENIKVLDICYGIGYNSKALMSHVIKNTKIKKEILIYKIIKKIFPKFFQKKTQYKNNTETIYNDNIANKRKMLLPYVDSVDNDNIISFFEIDCLESNEELIKLSPFFKTVKTPYEIFSMFVPDILNCFDTYYKIREFFANIISFFMPRNKKEINDLLELKFRNMHIDKEYKIHKYVNYIILNILCDKYGKKYLDKETQKNLSKRGLKKYFDKNMIKYAKFNQFWGYKTSSNGILSTFLHNIYYHHISRRYNNIKFNEAEKLFKLSFYINDARKSILKINKVYDCIFLDAFTYTKSPQLWTMEFIAELYKRISPTGVLLTYSNSAQIRNTLIENNFYVGKIYNKKTNKFVGTIASKDKSKIEYPLNSYEVGLCATKAGIPYHDPNLSFSSKDIIDLREYEFRHSNLISSSKYMKLRGLSSSGEE